MMRPTRANKPNGYLLGSYRIATAPIRPFQYHVPPRDVLGPFGPELIAKSSSEARLTSNVGRFAAS